MKLACALILCLALPAEAFGQGRGVMPLDRLDGPIVLDGEIVEAAWDRIQPIPMTMYSPVYRGEATERTEVRLAYDDDYLYASGRLYDGDPSGIRTNSLYRDRWSGDDAFALYIDSFNDNESSLWFTINPAGVRMDRLIGSDGDEVNSSWDTYWDVETSVTDQGWFFEMRIPFSSLRFQSAEERVTMGITATRLIARKNERVTFPAIDPRFEFRKPSVAQDMLLEGVVGGRPAYVTPYVLTGVDRSVIPPTVIGQPYTAGADALGEVGLDVKYSLTDNFFLDATLNTDFAQVEADDQQINLTRFPLFFPEKRQFFQERSDIFQFTFGSGGRLFHSRRIGLNAARDPVRLLGGMRLAGRVGDWDIGSLSLQSARTDGLPSENFSVVRAKRRVINPFSYAGAIVTSRADEDGDYNLGLGTDLSVRIFGDDYLTLKSSSVVDRDLSFDFVRSSHLFLDWVRRASRGLRYQFRVNRAGPNFQPAVGFLPRSDFTFFQIFGEYNLRGDAGSMFRTWGPGWVSNLWLRNEDRSVESVRVGHWYNYEFPGGASGWVEVLYKYEDVRTTFGLGEGAEIPIGSYDFFTGWFYYQAGPGSLIRPTLDVQAGTFYDGTQLKVALEPVWNISRFLEVSGGYEINMLRFTDRDQSLNTHLVRLRLRGAVDAKLSAAALVQYNSVADLVGVNLRVRYNFREGNDLWLVWDEGLNSDRDPADPLAVRLPLSNSRALRAKFTYTFSL